MAITPDPHTTPAAVLEAVRGPVVELSERLPSGWTDDELVDGMTALQRHRSSLDALETVLLAEVDSREIPKKQLHWGSTADWFIHLTGGFRRDGRRRVRHARALTSDRTATLDEVRSGQTSMSQAGLICDAVDTLPGNPALRDQAEQVLLEQSKSLTATELLRAGRHIAAVVDPDGEERAVEAALDREERTAHLNRRLSIVGDGMGGVRISGGGSLEDGEVLRAALLPAPDLNARSIPTSRPVGPSATPATTVPGCGTRWWRPPSTRSIRSSRPPPTVPDPGSRSPRPRSSCAPDWATAVPPRPASSCPSPQYAVSPATPTSFPAYSAPTARSSTSVAP